MFVSKKGLAGVDDMVMLPKINEGAIVDNLQKRYQANAIYVSTVECFVHHSHQ